jgi:riboflavin synthase
LFTGIVEEIGRVTSARPGRLTVAAAKVLEDMENGASIAVNGVCLTVTGFDDKSFSVEVMEETLSRTNLGLLKSGDGVNLERPLTLGGRLGGHLVQGHIDTTGKVISVTPQGESVIAGFEAPPRLMSYIVEKGFIAVDGVSLTVANRNSSSFWVSLVDYTRQTTMLGSLKAGDTVNLEADIIAKHVEQFNRNNGSGITVDFLQEHGFLIG